MCAPCRYDEAALLRDSLQQLQQRYQDAAAKSGADLAGTAGQQRFRIGQRVEHRELGYRAVVYGWGPFQHSVIYACGCLLYQPCLAPGWLASMCADPCCMARATPYVGGMENVARMRSGRHRLMYHLFNMERSRPSTMCLWMQGTGQQTQAMCRCQWPMLPMRSCMLHRFNIIPLDYAYSAV